MWKDIPNFEEYYMINEKGEVFSKRKNTLVVGDVNNYGYHRICLYKDNNKKRFFLHRLVAEIFIDNPNNYREVNHIDGNKNNNHVNNLEWCSRTHNEHHCRRNKIKEYKPYVVLFDDGREMNFEFKSELSSLLHISSTLIKYWLHKTSATYVNYGIKSIEYCFDKSLTTSENK